MSDPERPGVGLDDVAWVDGLGGALAGRAFEGHAGEAPDHVVPLSRETNDFAEMYPALIGTLPGNLGQRSLGALCWAVAVESALLDRQIRDEVRRMAASGRLDCEEASLLRFSRPRPDAASIEAFERYVVGRWPAVVFALDPVADEQNVAESRRLGRELRAASAFAVSSGQVGGNLLSSYLREATRATDAVDLNRTVVAFAHGNSSFGWRFTPRFQDRGEAPGALHALGQSAAGSLGHDLQPAARLEPGVRELSVAVLLPSFLPAVRLDASAGWYPLGDPGRAVLDSGWILEEGRGVEQARRGLASACDSGAYRAVDVAGLSARLERLEARLPQQSYKVDVPHQNALGGFELFTSGTISLSPELVGYEGAAEVDPRGGDVVFLLARNVDLGATRVIAGGRPVEADRVEILSREVIRLTLPPCVRPSSVRGREAIEVHLATPNGVSNRLAIPALPAPPVVIVAPPPVPVEALPPPPPSSSPFAPAAPPPPSPLPPPGDAKRNESP